MDARRAQAFRARSLATGAKAARGVIAFSTGSIASATGTSRPSSADSDVTPASGMPHGIMLANAVMSGSQLSAKPCIVTPRATRTPIAATLRSGRVPSAATHTPLRPSTRPVASPKPAHTSMSASSSRRT